MQPRPRTASPAVDLAQRRASTNLGPAPTSPAAATRARRISMPRQRPRSAEHDRPAQLGYQDNAMAKRAASSRPTRSSLPRPRRRHELGLLQVQEIDPRPRRQQHRAIRQRRATSATIACTSRHVPCVLRQPTPHQETSRQRRAARRPPRHAKAAHLQEKVARARASSRSEEALDRRDYRGRRRQPRPRRDSGSSIGRGSSTYEPSLVAREQAQEGLHSSTESSRENRELRELGQQQQRQSAAAEVVRHCSKPPWPSNDDKNISSSRRDTTFDHDYERQVKLFDD